MDILLQLHHYQLNHNNNNNLLIQDKQDMLELLKHKDNHVYKSHKFKFSILMDKKLRKENQLLLLLNGLLNHHQVERSMEMQELEVILKFSTLEVINVNNLIMEIYIGKLI